MRAPTIAPVSVEMADRLAALHGQCVAPAWDGGAMTEILSLPGSFGLIAGSGEQADGLLIGRLAVDEAEILTLGVHPRARRRGLGQALVAAALGQMAAGGATSVFLEVATDNEAACGLYRGAGFQVVGRRRGYYDRGGGARADAWVMRRPIAAGPTLASTAAKR